MNKTKSKVLFVDDEGEWSGPYVEHLGQHFDVVPFRDPLEASKYLDTNLDVNAVVVDIMMPTPENVSANLTSDGELCGLWFISEIRNYITGFRCPIVVLTNKTMALFSKQLDTLGIPPTLITCRQKRDTSRSQLPVIVEQMISRVGKG
jgi:CheY-like chemotaxis protein